VCCLELLPQAGPQFAQVRAGPRELRELRYAALLHDFGKVGVREHVLVKAEKLYPHQLELIRARFGRARLDAELNMLRARLALVERHGAAAVQAEVARLEAAWRARDQELASMLAFIEKANRPTVLEAGGFERLGEIGALLEHDERQNLAIPRGSLNDVERKEIESHVVHTRKFLEQIPWTRELGRVPEIAGAHHEKLDGTGYPHGLGADAIPVEARIMTIADIYDALTAADRPYKSALPHARALEILESEAARNKIDRALFQVFVEADVAARVSGRRDAEATLELRPILGGASPRR
jgi:response regulator RpfG family c-di-GMP phosphodiesterase